MEIVTSVEVTPAVDGRPAARRTASFGEMASTMRRCGAVDVDADGGRPMY